MKKLLLSVLLATVLTACSDDSDEYPTSCAKLEDLTNQAAELMPQMKAQLDAAGDEATRKKDARDAYAKMTDSEKAAAAKGCEVAVPQMESLIKQFKESQ